MGLFSAINSFFRKLTPGGRKRDAEKLQGTPSGEVWSDLQEIKTNGELSPDGQSFVRVQHESQPEKKESLPDEYKLLGAMLDHLQSMSPEEKERHRKMINQRIREADEDDEKEHYER